MHLVPPATRRAFWVRALLLCAVLFCGVASGAEPTSLNRAVLELRQARGVEKYAALRAVWRQWDQTDPAEVEEAIAAAERDKTATAPLRAYASILAAYARRRRGDLEGARAKIRAAGMVDRWLVLGPFDNEGKDGVDRAFAPEKELAQPIDLTRPYDGKERPVRWRVAPDVYGYGWLDLGDLIRPREKACAFATTFVRAKTGAGSPHLPVLRRHRDGSYRSAFGGKLVRVVEAEITITTTAGAVTGTYRLITTLLDHHRHPAAALIRLYHERWEIETAYLELKSSILGGRVLRARTPAGIDQEVYALLVTYQVLRTAMTDATNSTPGIDPDRASFTTALHAARDQVVQAAGVIADTVIDLVGAIGRLVLDNLMPDRRLRTNPRVVKRAISKFVAKNATGRARAPSRQATITIKLIASVDP